MFGEFKVEGLSIGECKVEGLSIGLVKVGVHVPIFYPEVGPSLLSSEYPLLGGVSSALTDTSV